MVKLNIEMYNTIEKVKFIGNIYNVSLNLRRTKEIIIEEPHSNFNTRPQQHVLGIMPYGTLKTAILNRLEKTAPNDVYTIDNVTIASLYGTINKNGQYIEGIISKCGGKILGIDEWDTLYPEVQQSFLQPLENQKVSKQIMFAVKEPIEVGNDYFTQIKVNSGSIEGKVKFTCLAMSMDFNMRTQKQFALGSRFKIIRLSFNEDELLQIIKGLMNFDFIDRNQTVEKVLVKNEAWSAYSDTVYKKIKEENMLIPLSMKGFINRSIHDGLRNTVGNLIIKEPQSNYIIKDSCVLLESLDDILIQLKMYTVNIPTIEKLKLLLINGVFTQDYKYYCKELNISPKQFYRLRDNIEGKIKSEEIINNDSIE